METSLLTVGTRKYWLHDPGHDLAVIDATGTLTCGFAVRDR